MEVVDSRVETPMKMSLQLKKKETLSWRMKGLSFMLVDQAHSTRLLLVLVVYLEVV